MSVNVSSGSTISFTRTVANTAALTVDTSSTITNAGTVTLTGTTPTGRGAALLGANNSNTLVNTATGVITTTGGQNDGMAINGNGGSLTNNGTITVSGPNAYGMTAAWGQASGLGQNSTFVNTGTITANGSGSRAISVVGGQSTVTNSGTLITTGGVPSNRAFTVFMQGNNNNFTNSGYIEARGINSDAVVSNTGGGICLIHREPGGRANHQPSGLRRAHRQWHDFHHQCRPDPKRCGHRHRHEPGSTFQHAHAANRLANHRHGRRRRKRGQPIDSARHWHGKQPVRQLWHPARSRQ
ncbi:MAG: hypothetical protein P4M06_13930 [Pandoraea sp.]|nr:hypothetical protein [Pandoraea sp.]MDR3398643.1 hypothetical protein [Pandoraea sp.]